MIVTVQIYDNLMRVYHRKGYPVNMIDAVSRLMTFYKYIFAKNMRISSPYNFTRVITRSDDPYGPDL